MEQYGSTKHKVDHFQCKPVTLIWISYGKFAWPLQVASQTRRLYIRKHNAWRGDRHRHSKNAFPFGSGLRSSQNFFSFIKSKVGESCAGYSHGNCYCYEDHAIKVENHFCDAEVHQWTVAISPLVNFLIKSHVTIKFVRSSVSNKRDYWA